MHNFFNVESSASLGILRFPEWSWVRDGLQRNLRATVDYYRQHPRAVKSDHFLVRLLGSISVPKSQPLERYYDNVDAIALNMSMALKMTSSIYKGFPVDGYFYGPGSSEILIAHNASFNIFEAHRDWQNLAPVRVLRHPRSDLAFQLPDGSATEETGLAVIAVNIPMLAIQYRAFRLAENEITDHVVESQRSVMQFVHMYVLPNMLFSQTDQTLFNRIDRIAQKLPLGSSRSEHAFYLPESFATRCDEVQRKILQGLLHVGKDFASTLQSIPAVDRDTMEAVMRLPAMASTRQVDWALTIARLPALSFLFRSAKQGVAMRNQREVNQIQRSVQSYQTGNIFRQMLPERLRLLVQTEVDEVLTLPSVGS